MPETESFGGSGSETKLEFFFPSKSLNKAVLLLFTIIKASSRRGVVLLSRYLIESIHTNGQYFNWDFPKLHITDFLEKIELEYDVFTLSLTKVVYTVLRYKLKVNNKTRKHLLTFRCDEIVVSIGSNLVITTILYKRL